MKTKPEQSQDSIAGYHDLVRREVFHLIPKGTSSLLDVGGGIGATAIALKQQGLADRVAVADIITTGFLPDLDAAYSGNLEDPAFFKDIHKKEGSVDTILLLDVLEHLSDPWSVVKSAHTLLSSQGVLIASVPNMRFWSLSWNLFARGQFDLTDKGLHDRTHLRWFVRKTAIELMTCSGLRLDVIEGRIPARRYKAANGLTLGMTRGLWEMQYFIRVSKRQ